LRGPPSFTLPGRPRLPRTRGDSPCRAPKQPQFAAQRWRPAKGL
jgi:hypothetical protein